MKKTIEHKYKVGDVVYYVDFSFDSDVPKICRLVITRINVYFDSNKNEYDLWYKIRGYGCNLTNDVRENQIMSKEEAKKTIYDFLEETEEQALSKKEDKKETDDF